MKTIGIIGAMPSELVDIRKKLSGEQVKNIAGFDYYIDNVNGKTIVNVCSGIAKVNAAVCTQVLIDNFKCDAVINAGIAGGMNNEIKVCDMVISNEVLPHDLDQHFLVDYPPYNGIFKADEKLIDAAVKICENQGVKSFTGRIVSGDAFITDTVIKKGIVDKFSPFAVDMESAAVGQCAFLNKVPFVSVRCISDNADDDGAMSFDEFEKIAANRVAQVVLEMIEIL
ncbi:MAG: 5'-methylthioadenosine/adenosylhomocysteine nucleosidase [Ruminococcus sp.]|nr:5'-methylthioadenosine/adenosylhomocysteine nucleosidase [Ruminococcus sp.]MBR6599688.1 5'-methylthioadenosine/adenosylhomocysteine nucleosidase [Oscillospiraceae bacterium]